MTTPDPDDLAARLTAWAQGVYGTEAAVQLVVEHDAWLRRDGFAHHTLIQLDEDDVDDAVVAIDWPALAKWADDAPASSSEHQIMAIALSLAGEPRPEPLNELIAGLDATNTTRVLNAVARCAGWAARHHAARIDGYPGGGGP
jgi:ABC-type cobalamin/Fe3+-siderophores transport system ATPase subunit